MIKRIIAVVFGVLVAIGVIFILEAAGHLLYPTPQGLALDDPQKLKEAIAALPLPEFIIVLAAWMAGAFLGSFGALFFARSSQIWVGGIVTLFVFVAAVSNFFFVAYPIWFEIAAVLGIPLASWLAWKMYRARQPDA
ncbi:MAG TPA: hypothetical protein ENK26_07985 [Gammaproteobacteria bacterium]|nr:hypothetical protein [Gammaproteobacteria bacterium]